jgi:hypothetical protein
MPPQPGKDSWGDHFAVERVFPFPFNGELCWAGNYCAIDKKL